MYTQYIKRKPSMSTEIYWLVSTLIFTSIMWVPYIINRIVETGIWPALYNPQPDTQPKAQWARRMMSAHENAVENLVIFAPLVILVEVTATHSNLSSNAVILYFYARVIHFFVFTFGIPVLRVPAFVAGFIAQILLALNLLNNIY